jgi:pyruvate dehydrogenase E2 component (dihydrolipoamide acetyltransferase)
MVDKIIMPKLGFDMAEGTLVRWVVSEGSPITNKATVEVESSFTGVVLQHLVGKGDVVPVNTPIAMIGQPGESIDNVSPVMANEKTVNLADSNQELPDQSASKKISFEPGIPDGVRASPLARRLAKSQGVDLKNINGSGPGGRVIRKDVESFLINPPQIVESKDTTFVEVPSPNQEKQFAEPQGIDFDIGLHKPDEIVPINRLRAAIGRRMIESKAPIPHFYVTYEYNLNNLMILRKQLNEFLPESEKLSVNDFVVKAVALTLRKFTNLNATINGNQVIRYGSIHVGVAVAVENGLLTVVCKNADRKPIRLIGNEIRNMAKRAREGKVRPEDIEGSTFSVSNLGMYDVESFIAIINPPEAAILAVGSAREVPVVEKGEIKPGWRMKTTISVDHRISDGVEAAQFLKELAIYLEQPLSLIL